MHRRLRNFAWLCFVCALFHTFGSVSIADDTTPLFAQQYVDTDFPFPEHSLLRTSFESSGASQLIEANLLPTADAPNPALEGVAQRAIKTLEYPIDTGDLSLTRKAKSAGRFATSFTTLLGTRRYDDLIAPDQNLISSGIQTGFRIAVNRRAASANNGIELVALALQGDHTENVDYYGLGAPDLSYASQLLSGEINYTIHQQSGPYARKQLIGIRIVGQNEDLDSVRYWQSSYSSINQGAGSTNHVVIDYEPYSQELSHRMLGIQVGYDGSYRQDRFSCSAGVRAAVGGDRADLTTTHYRYVVWTIANPVLGPPGGGSYQPSHATIEKNVGVRSLLEYQCSIAYALRPRTQALLGIHGLSLARYDDVAAAITEIDGPELLHFFALQAGIQHRW